MLSCAICSQELLGRRASYRVERRTARLGFRQGPVRTLPLTRQQSPSYAIAIFDFLEGERVDNILMAETA